VIRNYVSVVELLLDHQANSNTRNRIGVTPLGLAFQSNNEAMVKLLLAHGADVNAIGVNVGDSAAPPMVTALAYTALYGKSELAELLLKNKADINTQDEQGMTALHWAVRSNKEDIVRLLLANGADVNAKDKNDSTPWLQAVREKNQTLIKLLVDKGADMNVKSKDGWAGLLEALSGEPKKDLVELYLANKADPNRQRTARLHGPALGCGQRRHRDRETPVGQGS
jgi:ankyrin repeat protein